ncbi:MAG: Flp family type IVb pilin [Chloroflexi bacterium]|jgi:pilus assembly protein Flp/PilA|nr:Flp family type IVb pilin [Chloroflexota bacterium]MCZ7575636.1 Flp family type IVb pilin [Dehalococcoidia bacterium]NJD63976.1 Flp family type IVb pilin [Chloroflexota bacterium]PWB42549.1 MAG: Flp family type IVb pilin [Dehalococcoidia bacterium]
MSKIKNWAISKVAKYQIAKEEGQGLAEYGLILALIAIVCIAALTLLGGNVRDALNSVANSI